MKRSLLSAVLLLVVVGCAHASAPGEIDSTGAHWLVEPKARVQAKEACHGQEPQDWHEQYTGIPAVVDRWRFTYACPGAAAVDGGAAVSNVTP